jgi:hypothetical protein
MSAHGASQIKIKKNANFHVPTSQSRQSMWLVMGSNPRPARPCYTARGHKNVHVVRCTPYCDFYTCRAAPTPHDNGCGPSPAIHQKRRRATTLTVACAQPRRKTIFKWVELNSSVFWVITRCKVTWNRSFGTTYRYHLQGCGSPSWTAWPSNMRPICSTETSVSNHLTTRNNPGDRIIRVTTSTFLSHECPV